MKIFNHFNALLLASTSAMAMMSTLPAAMAEEEDSQRTLGTVLVTTQKKAESIQDVPIAVSAFDQDALEKLQLAGGPDLVKTIPNVNFTKGNFGGFNFRIRGIGVDAVSTSSDAGVGVHMNDVPLTSNSFFEAEFYDVERVETLRGPQGTLYGRNATGGVVNVITAKPVLEEFQANASLTYGNYNSIKAKGMVNLPMGETVALRLAGSYLSRDGYVENLTTGNDIDSRDLYSVRASLAYEPTDRFRGLLILEHFNEDDSRLRSGKQLCDQDPISTSFAGLPISAFDQTITSQGCVDNALSAPESLEGLNNIATLGGQYGLLAGLIGGIDGNGNLTNFNANTSGIPSDLRTIESLFDPTFETEQTLITWKGEFDLTDSLTATYLGSYNERSNTSQEDYNEQASDVAFNTSASPFVNLNGPAAAAAFTALYPSLFPGGVVSDPQLGPLNSYAAADISGNESEQTTHELRLQSDFDGRFNFNLGAIKVDYEINQGPAIQESYYVFFNTSAAFNQINNAASALGGGGQVFSIENSANVGATPIENISGTARHYFRTITPYTLDSFALFGEGYYDVSDTLKFTLGLRYTDDKKEVLRIPTYLSVPDAVIPDPLSGTGTSEAAFEEVTGRIGFDWSPDLDFTSDSLFYAFYSRGYKGGGINPPQPSDNVSAFPAQFEPEFVDAYELGTKNTSSDGSVQFNATGFMYNYEGYQISQIVNRTSANFNVDAEVAGLEFEAVFNPVSTLVVNANIGHLSAEIVDTYGIDVLDRTNGRGDLVVLKQFPGASNCVVSAAGYATVLGAIAGGALDPGSTLGICSGALVAAEALLGLSGVSVTYTDSNGMIQTASALTPFEGDAKNLDGKALPGTPDTTFSLGAEYTWEGLGNGVWDLRLRGDYYYQSDAYSRVWNTERDRLESWDNVNLSLQLANTEKGLTIEAFGKNITDEEVITGAYLTDDSSGLFTNVFLTEPATYGVSISKTW